MPRQRDNERYWLRRNAQQNTTHQSRCSRFVRTANGGKCARSQLSFDPFFQAEDGIRDIVVTGVQTCALPISAPQLGDHPDARLAQEFSSSEYSKTIGGIVVGQPPPIDLDAENRLIKFLGAAAAEGRVLSAHDISDGGLAVTLAESCFAAAPSTVGARHAAPALGATVNLDNDFAPNEYALFGEQGARAIVSVQPS